MHRSSADRSAWRRCRTIDVALRQDPIPTSPNFLVTSSLTAGVHACGLTKTNADCNVGSLSWLGGSCCWRLVGFAAVRPLPGRLAAFVALAGLLLLQVDRPSWLRVCCSPRPSCCLHNPSRTQVGLRSRENRAVLDAHGPVIRMYQDEARMDCAAAGEPPRQLPRLLSLELQAKRTVESCGDSFVLSIQSEVKRNLNMAFSCNITLISSSTSTRVRC